MKFVALSALWILAALLAAGVLWRIIRKKRVVLTGRWSPRLVQMVAAIVVALSPLAADDPAFAGDEGGVPGQAAPGKAPAKKADPLPLDTHTLKVWRQRYAHAESPIAELKKRFGPLDSGAQSYDAKEAEQIRRWVQWLPKGLQQIMTSDLAALGAGLARPVVPGSELLAALTEMEKNGCLDGWFLGYLWRASGRHTATDRVEDVALYAGLRRHARIIDMLTVARLKSSVRDYQPRAWMSKAGPSKAEYDHESAALKRLSAAVAKQWPLSTADSWTRDSFAEIGLAEGSGSALLHRGGAVHVLESKEALMHFGRLDLLETPGAGEAVVLRHAWLGDIPLQGSRTYSVWELPGVLPTLALGHVRHAVEEALKGDEGAALRLESTLPFSHAELRRGLANSPKAPGAPRMRTILSLFEERVLPAPKAN